MTGKMNHCKLFQSEKKVPKKGSLGRKEDRKRGRERKKTSSSMMDCKSESVLAALDAKTGNKVGNSRVLRKNDSQSTSPFRKMTN